MKYNALTCSGIIKMSIFIFTMSVILGYGEVYADQKGTGKGKEAVLKIEPGPDNPRNSEGDFITLKDGRILFIYSHFSTRGDNGNAVLAGRISSDKGMTWSREDRIIVGQEGKMNVMSVSLLRLRNGQIALFYLRKNSETDCIPMLRLSADEAVTWSDPKPCITDREGYFVLNNNRVIQLKSGRLIMAVSLHQTPGEPKTSLMGRLRTYFSDDNGRTWKSGAEVPNPGKVIVQEPGLAELKNGNIFMLMRTDRGVQYVSFSKDNGETWSPVEPGNMASPRSPASIARIPSTGDLLLVWNNNGITQSRTPLNLAISRDEGNSWEKIKTIEDDPAGSYCYTAIHFAGKYVLLGYACGRGLETLTRISLDWIYK
jgi:sialidase-1